VLQNVMISSENQLKMPNTGHLRNGHISHTRNHPVLQQVLWAQFT